MSPSTVSDYLGRTKREALTWEQARELSDAEVEARLFKIIGRSEPASRAPIDGDWVHRVHRELGRVGVTLQLLWGEYQLAAQSAGVRPYQYSQYCELYAAWRDQRRLSMRQVHRPGEKLFLGYSGKKPRLCDPETGEVMEVELFVAVLGASNYTYAGARGARLFAISRRAPRERSSTSMQRRESVYEYVPRNIFVVMFPPGLCAVDRGTATGPHDSSRGANVECAPWTHLS